MTLGNRVHPQRMQILQVRYAGGGDVLQIQLDISSGTTGPGVAPVYEQKLVTPVYEQEMVSRGSPARR